MTERLDRLYNLLPAIYRIRDSEQGEVQRALLQVITEQLLLIEENTAQLYDNWFIETAEDWAVAYIGDLVGYQALDSAGEKSGALQQILFPRRDVANTIRYRTQKGTLALLEELAHSTAGWPARAVEFFETLSRSQSMRFLHLREGGTTNVRDSLRSSRLSGPFNRNAHTVDVRRMNSHHSTGRMNLPNVGIYVWRLRPFPITGGKANRRTGRQPFHVDRRAGRFTFSALGNDAPLFTHPIPETSPLHIAGVMNVPAALSRRELQANLEQYYGEGKSFCLYKRIQSGGRQKSAAGRRKEVEYHIETIPPDQIVVANLKDWFYRPAQGKVAVDPEYGRIAFGARETPEDLLVHYHNAFSANLGGGEYHRQMPPAATNSPLVWTATVTAGDRNHRTPINDCLRRWEQEKPLHGVIEIADSSVYSEQIMINFDEDTPGQTLELRAADRCFPVIRLLNMFVNQSDDLCITGGPGNRFTLSGLLIACRGVRVVGELDRVDVSHCTLVPGWEMDADCNPCCEQEPSLTIVDGPVVQENGYLGAKEQPVPAAERESGCQTVGSSAATARTSRIVVSDTILGSIWVVRDAVQREPLPITLRNCILDATASEIDAISTPDGTVAHAALEVFNSTVIGEIHIHAITLGENTIFKGLVQVARSQVGCLRFSSVMPGSHTPRRFHCQPDQALKDFSEDMDRASILEQLQPHFNALRYGKPDYCQLSADCASEIRQGAEDESEMGAFHDLYQPQREANLRARLAEYTPAGSEAGIIFVS
jgi:hypothetical protein